jgi:hypothetical protein
MKFVNMGSRGIEARDLRTGRSAACDLRLQLVLGDVRELRIERYDADARRRPTRLP